MKLFRPKADGIKLLEVHEVASCVVELVRSSEEWLLLISPYFQPWRHLDDAIVDAMAKGIGVDFLVRTNQLAKARKHFRRLGLRPRALKRLHAKIYINERTALLSSMNLYDGSRESLEFGMWIDRTKQSELYESCRKQAIEHFERGTECDVGFDKARQISSTQAKPVQQKPAVKQKSAVEHELAQKRQTTPLKSSEYESLSMWRKDLSVAQISKKRGIKESTVYSHLAAAIRVGWVRVDDVVSESSRKALSAGLREVGPEAELAALVHACPQRVTFGEAACVLAAFEVHKAIQSASKENQ